MSLSHRWSAAVAGCGLALLLAVSPVWAGRVTRTNDAGYEITRIVSQLQGGTSETIAPDETHPDAPISGETLFYGTSNLFPEFGKVFAWDGKKWVELDPSNFSFNADVMVAGGTGTPFKTTYYVTFRFAANKVSLLQNHFVLFQIFPMPSTQSPGDTVEGLFLKKP